MLAFRWNIYCARVEAYRVVNWTQSQVFFPSLSTRPASMCCFWLRDNCYLIVCTLKRSTATEVTLKIFWTLRGALSDNFKRCATPRRVVLWSSWAPYLSPYGENLHCQMVVTTILYFFDGVHNTQNSHDYFFYVKPGIAGLCICAWKSSVALINDDRWSQNVKHSQL